MPAFEWVHVQLHQQKGMISLSPPTICNSANYIQSDPNTFSSAYILCTYQEITCRHPVYRRMKNRG
ncbi:hypothetical protein CJ409_22020 [Salmonella enterica]|nr:hypothetical protein [Salmonella enterica]